MKIDELEKKKALSKETEPIMEKSRAPSIIIDCYSSINEEENKYINIYNQETPSKDLTNNLQKII